MNRSELYRHARTAAPLLAASLAFGACGSEPKTTERVDCSTKSQELAPGEGLQVETAVSRVVLQNVFSTPEANQNYSVAVVSSSQDVRNIPLTDYETRVQNLPTGENLTVSTIQTSDPQTVDAFVKICP